MQAVAVTQMRVRCLRFATAAMVHLGPLIAVQATSARQSHPNSLRYLAFMLWTG